MSQLKQPAIQQAANEINRVNIQGDISAIQAMISLDKKIQEAILERKYSKHTQNTDVIVNGKSIREEINREFIE